ncbi:GntR family transcriptional regulator [Elstera litoralis]|uniref:GntR family transcriptional regulator n=1 Tax=Elstera litoralis TaxID=552518 RepID=UPI000B2B79CB|nr:GntR family transcriptional regulator [Elstera litoralis]
MDTNFAPDVRPDSADRPASLHQKIYDEIEGNILSGAWPPGHRLQFEVELAAHYGCSRMTVNKVLTQMVKAGLIERRRKSGSFVAYPRAESAILDIRDIKQEVEALGLTYGYERLTRLRRLSIAEDRKRLEVTPADAVLALTARHRAGRKPSV